MRDHIVVCGLGNIGYRIVKELARREIPVVVVEILESGRFLPAARRLGVPVVVAVMVLARTRVEAGSQAEGRPITDLEDGTETRVLVLTSDDHRTWRPPRDTVLIAGQELTIVATRRGYAQAVASLGGRPRQTTGPTLPVS
jgi:Trk K+ transport system NAD-binding subunit